MDLMLWKYKHSTEKLDLPNRVVPCLWFCGCKDTVFYDPPSAVRVRCGFIMIQVSLLNLNLACCIVQVIYINIYI